ncbi:MAG: hypothetical protein ACMUIS_10690 [bacterium]
MSKASRVNAYYGGYGGYSSLLGGYGGLLGGYGGYGGLMGGLYGGLLGGYGGLMGGYGLMGGLMGGLYGGLMGGYGGLMGGYGGMYGGMMSPFSFANMYYPVQTTGGLTYQVPFLQIAPLLGVAGLYNQLFPNLFNPQPQAAPIVNVSTPTSLGVTFPTPIGTFAIT